MLSNLEILKLVKTERLIDPCEESPIYEVKSDSYGSDQKVLPYGLRECSYTARLASDLRVYEIGQYDQVDPKSHNSGNDRYVGYTTDIPPGVSGLARTEETFCLPEDVAAICFGIEHYANCGLQIAPLYLHPGFDECISFFFRNCLGASIRIYPGEGVLDVLFFRVNGDLEDLMRPTVYGGGLPRFPSLT